MSSQKKTKNISRNFTKKTTIERIPDNKTIVWYFDKLDKNGKFAFDLNRKDFDVKDFLSKMILYSNMTWAEVDSQTHDKGKSKHHYLLEFERLSKEARERIIAMKFETDYSDCIFSFAFNNTLRIIGIRDNGIFHVVWYDPRHEFYPVSKKHT